MQRLEYNSYVTGGLLTSILNRVECCINFTSREPLLLEDELDGLEDVADGEGRLLEAGLGRQKVPGRVLQRRVGGVGESYR